MFRLLLISCAVLCFATGCGVGVMPSKHSSAEALTGTAEILEFETPAVRHELFLDLARTSQAQAGSTGAVVFPVLKNGDFVAAPGLDSHADLLLESDAGSAVALNFASGALGFADDRRDSLQGLSEREAAEMIARCLLVRWNVRESGAISVERAPGVPYAVAYIDGVLRINPAFVYMASAPAVP